MANSIDINSRLSTRCVDPAQTIPIFNLSTHNLSQTEASLLSQSLSFVPILRPNLGDLQTDILTFFW